MITSIANLTNEQARAIAEDMFRRGRQALGNQIVALLEERLMKPRPKKRPRKRVAQTGELA